MNESITNISCVIALDVFTNLLVSISEYDSDVFQHCVRVGALAEKITDVMGVKPQEQVEVFVAAVLHDYGKIKIPKSILLKKSALTAEEYRVIQHHPVDGAETIRKCCSNENVVNAILYHHERLDGSGYTTRISGDLLPFGARIIAVADVYDALVNHRCYKVSNSPKEAIELLRRKCGTEFDSDVVSALREVIKNEL